MPGLFLALRDALGFLVLAVLALSVVGLVWRGALAAWQWVLMIYPALVLLVHDGRTWLALFCALVIALVLKPGGYTHE